VTIDWGRRGGNELALGVNRPNSRDLSQTRQSMVAWIAAKSKPMTLRWSSRRLCGNKSRVNNLQEPNTPHVDGYLCDSLRGSPWNSVAASAGTSYF